MSAVETGATEDTARTAGTTVSTADTTPAAAGATPTTRTRWLSTRFLRSELRLIFGRRRNWVGMAILATVPIVLAVVTRIGPPGGEGGGEANGPDFVASITENGLFVALASLAIEIPLFLPIAVAAISADTIAGEANLGTLRYLLAVPVHRTRLLAVKYAAVVVFAFVATLFVAAVGAVMGLVLFGGGPITLLSGTQASFGEATLRLLAICVYLATGLAALGAIGMFVSTMTEQPIAATVTIMIINMLSFTLDAISQLDWLHPYLLTHYWLYFGDLLRAPVNLDGIGQGLLVAGVYAAIFWSAAWARFGGRDVSG